MMIESALPARSRIVIVGTSGSGKTTLAKEIAAVSRIEHIELDLLHHGPGWRPRDDFAARVADAVARDAWVCDGNYSQVREAVWARATAFVWLDYSLPRTLARGLARTVRRVASRQEVFPVCRETFRAAFLSGSGIPVWILRTHYRHRQTYPALFATPAFRDVSLARRLRPSFGHELDGRVGANSDPYGTD